MADQFSEAERSRASGLADRQRTRVAPGIKKHDSEHRARVYSENAYWNTILNVLNIPTYTNGTTAPLT